MLTKADSLEYLSFPPPPPPCSLGPHSTPHIHSFHPALSSFLCRQQRFTQGSLPHTGTCLACLIRDLGPEIRCLIYPQLPRDPRPYHTATSFVFRTSLAPASCPLVVPACCFLPRPHSEILLQIHPLKHLIQLSTPLAFLT